MQKEPVTIRCSGKEVNESWVKRPVEPLRQKQKPKKSVSGQTEQSEWKKTKQQKHRARMTEEVHMHTQQEINTEKKKQEKQYIFNSAPETRKHAGKTGSRAS